MHNPSKCIGISQINKQFCLVKKGILNYLKKKKLAFTAKPLCIQVDYVHKNLQFKRKKNMHSKNMSSEL